MKMYSTVAVMALLSACAAPMMMTSVDNADLPEPVHVPASQKTLMHATADGPKQTGNQVAVAPAGVRNIPLQLVIVDSATGAAR